MKLFNQYGPMLLALGFVNGKPGELVSVMPDGPEEIHGPVFMRDEFGRIVSYYSIPGDIIVVASGHTDIGRGVLVMPSRRQIIHSWTGADLAQYRVIIKDYRELDSSRRL